MHLSKKTHYTKHPVKRGDIYLCNLGASSGSEYGGERTVVVVQNNTGNSYSGTTIVLICDSTTKRNFSTHLHFDFSPHDMEKHLHNFSYEPTTIMAEHIRTVDKRRLGKFLGRISTEFMNTKIDPLINIALDFAQGSLCWCDFGKPFGNEQGYKRTALIVQNPKLSLHTTTRIVLPCTTKPYASMPTQCCFSDKDVVLNYRRFHVYPSIAMAEQIRSIDTERFDECIGHLPKRFMINHIKPIIEISLGLT